jgi:hypothetical protein
VEATVKDVVCRIHRGKLTERGAFKASIFAFSIAMRVDFFHTDTPQSMAGGMGTHGGANAWIFYFSS